MCGRYAQGESASGLDEIYDIHIPPGVAIVPSWNVAPMQRAPIVGFDAAIGGRALRVHRWGLVPSWADDPKVGAKAINARAESVASRETFRAAFARRRCLVPASGFYEWGQTDGGRAPEFVRVTGARGVAFAGLWEQWTSPDGEPLRTFTVLTTGANALLRPIHDRMPVILPPGAWDAWLDPAARAPALQRLLVPYPADAMERWVVSARVGSAANDDPSLIEPVDGREPAARGGLF